MPCTWAQVFSSSQTNAVSPESVDTCELPHLPFVRQAYYQIMLIFVNTLLIAFNHFNKALIELFNGSNPPIHLKEVGSC